ncbi:hypothetical protein C8F01DRAFT_1242691 [Mycena amicta]|nr:hypothetical protein C8F01DRAFT_1242691 [Mycena amicta]
MAPKCTSKSMPKQTSSARDFDEDNEAQTLEIANTSVGQVLMRPQRSTLYDFFKNYDSVDFAAAQTLDQPPVHRIRQIANRHISNKKSHLSELDASDIKMAAPLPSSSAQHVIVIPCPPRIPRTPVLHHPLEISVLQNLTRVTTTAGSLEVLEVLKTLEDLAVDLGGVPPSSFLGDIGQENSPTFKSPAFEHSGSISQLSSLTVRDGKQPKFIITLFIVPAEEIFGKSIADVPWHSNVGIIVNNTKRGAGKDFLLCEPNVTPDDHDKPLNAFTQPWMRRLWVNHARLEQNNGGVCLPLCLEWILEILVEGLDLELDESGIVVGSNKFRQINL